MTETGQDIPADDGRYVAGDTATVVASVDLTDSNDDDLSESDIQFALADAPGRDPLVEKTRDDGISVPTETPTECHITLDPSDTEGLGDIGGREYYYEIQITDSTGSVATVTTGTWTIYPDTA